MDVQEIFERFGDDALDPCWVTDGETVLLEDDPAPMLIPKVRLKFTIDEWLDLPHDTLIDILRAFGESLAD